MFSSHLQLLQTEIYLSPHLPTPVSSSSTLIARAILSPIHTALNCLQSMQQKILSGLKTFELAPFVQEWSPQNSKSKRAFLKLRIIIQLFPPEHAEGSSSSVMISHRHQKIPSKILSLKNSTPGMGCDGSKRRQQSNSDLDINLPPPSAKIYLVEATKVWLYPVFPVGEWDAYHNCD